MVTVNKRFVLPALLVLVSIACGPDVNQFIDKREFLATYYSLEKYFGGKTAVNAALEKPLERVEKYCEKHDLTRQNCESLKTEVGSKALQFIREEMKDSSTQPK